MSPRRHGPTGRFARFAHLLSAAATAGRKPRRRRSLAAHRALRLESLESRAMLSSAPFIASLPQDLAGKTASLVTVHGRYGNNALNGDWELGMTSNTSAPPQKQVDRIWNSGAREPFTFSFTNTRSDTFTNSLNATFSIGGSGVQFNYGSQFASYEPNAIKIWARTTTATSSLTINDLKITTPGVAGETVFPGASIAVSQASGTVFQEIIIAGIDFQSVSGGTVTLQGNVTMQFGKDPALRGSALQFHVIATHIPWVDLDVDSNNNGTIDPVNGRNGTDDRIEQSAPGLIIPVGGDRAEMLVTLPAGRSATLQIDPAVADKVRVHKVKDRTQNTPLAFIPATANTPAKLDLSLLQPTSTTGTLNTWQLWVEALAPSTTAGDLVFTLTDDSSGPPTRDIVRATAVEANLVAHRTGGRLGEVIPEDLESAGDPNAYMILTNRDFEQGLPLAGRDFDDEIALLPPFNGPDGRVDDDLAKITLKRLPSGLNAGSVRLSVSHPDAVRLFKPVPGSITHGEVLSPGEWTASLASAGYLANLKSRDVDIWLEGLSMVKDFVFTVEYVAPSGSVLASDDVHMLIADWTFRGSDGYEVPLVSPVWLDALLAATDSPKKPLADPTGAFYKIHIDGLAPRLVTQLLVASDSTPDFYTESYVGDTDTNNDGTIDAADGDFDTAYSSATVSRRFGVMHSAAHVLYAPEDPLVTPAQRQLIRETLDLNVVHNDGLEGRVETAFDRHVAKLRAAPPFSIAVEKDVVPVNGRIRGTVTWKTHFPNDRPLFIYTSDGQETGPFYLNTAPGTTAFQFAATNAEAVEIGVGWKGQFAPRGFARFHGNKLVRVTADGTMPQWENEAWNALKVDDFVPGDAINRNRQITTQYANMFNSGKNPDQLNPFEWFGLAAFASRLAGNGMHAAMGLDWVPDVLGRVGVPDSRKLFQGLAEGNLEIFIDMYKAGLAYSSKDKLAAILSSNEFNALQKRAWEKIAQGQADGEIEVVWEGVDGLVDVEQRVPLQRVLDKDPALWRRATNNFGRHISKVAMISSPFPGDTSTFQDYRVNPDGNNPRIPADATFDQVEHRLTWIRSRIPEYRGGWRAMYDYIEITKLLNGDYNK